MYGDRITERMVTPTQCHLVNEPRTIFVNTNNTIASTKNVGTKPTTHTAITSHIFPGPKNSIIVCAICPAKGDISLSHVFLALI